jgi:Uma2 family endonuclease
MRQTILKIYTYKDLLEDKIPEEIFEVIEGIGVESMPFSTFHNRWVFEISKYLENVFSKDYWVIPHETSILVSKNPLTYINADIVLISRSRLNKITEHILEIPPDIVFEIVVSYEPNIEYKMNAYQKIGVLKQFWVYPKERKVIVIDKDGNKVEYPFNKKIEIIEGKKILLSRFKI